MNSNSSSNVAVAEKKGKTEKKLTASLITVLILAVCLCFTTFALIWASVSVENNLFHTGTVKINLNDGQPIIQEHEFLFEPGMTVRKSFFIENESTWDVYYRLYLDSVEGGLADVLQVTIQSGDKVLYQGTARTLTKEAVGAADDILLLKERRAFTATFYFPPEIGNEAQGRDLSFTLCADAVQTKNNPEKLFD